jgi:hypothetical protein
MSIATVVNWGADFVVPNSYLTLRHSTSKAGTSLTLVFLSVTAVAHAWRRVPGTECRRLEEIERAMAEAGHENDRVFYSRTGARK